MNCPTGLADRGQFISDKSLPVTRSERAGAALQRFMTGIFWRGAERLQSARRVEELVQANDRKDELLAMVCHELRSPLAAINFAVRLLSGSVVQAPTERAQTQALLERQLRNVGQLVEDLLDLSRIAKGRMQLQLRRIDLRVAVGNAIQTLAPEIQARGQRLATVQPDKPVWLMADPLRLEQVFQNLLGNAVKYTPPGGRLALWIHTRGPRAMVRIRDSGIGIEPGLLPHVFDLFRQSDGADTGSHAGLGIGLAIVRNLVEQHGGSVSAASRGSGQGSAFTVRLACEE
jgi:signal transduction histidine kinase